MPDTTDIAALLTRIRSMGKSKKPPMIPGQTILPGQKVQIEGVGEVCVVLRVDHQRHLADLLSLRPLRTLETGIPLALLTPAEESQQIDDDLVISA